MLLRHAQRRFGFPLDADSRGEPVVYNGHDAESRAADRSPIPT
jgi:hypothetical protein